MAVLIFIRARWRSLRQLGAGAACCLAFALVAPALAAAPVSATTAEYQVKAVFLFNFAQFVDWPARAFASGESPLVIGLLGDDPFGTYLDDLVRGEKIGGRRMVVQRFHRVEDITDCQILFVSRSEAATLAQILARLKGRSILTVGDVDSFNRDSGMVRFVTENGKIRMRINLQAAKAAGLEISSKLLRPATIVTAEQN